MEDKIPQSFKVQWLNTTLKFVKDDNQMVIEYPQMPIAQVEYLHNLIWQRQNNIGLGFKSLYAPLWEAMKIFSVKYQFQVSITKAATGDLGQLKIQKISKTANEECIKPPLELNNRETQKSTSPVYEKPNIMPQTNKSNEECSEVVKVAEEKTKKAKKLTKGQKFIAQARKIIDSIAPAFFKTTFQTIYEFLSDEASASYTFSDLAPNEAQFLQIFLGVYNRRKYFESFFSPYCNDLLNKMCIIFKEFDKTCKIDVCVGKTDSKTCKREIIFLKGPRYTNNTTSKAKLLKNPNDHLGSENETDRSSNKFLNALKYPTDDHNASIFGTRSDSRAIDNTDIETDDEYDNNATDKDISMVINNAMLKDVQKTAQKNYETKCDIIKKKKIENDLEAKQIFATAGKNANNMDNDIGYKQIKLRTKDDANNTEKVENRERVLESKKKKKVPEDLSLNSAVKDSKQIKINNKEMEITEELRNKMKSLYLKDDNTKKTPQVPKTGIVFAKASGNTDNVKVSNKGPSTKVIPGSKINKSIIEALSTPLESDKAMRMMRLMGWEGGALGVRGDGIIEPIIPDLNIKHGAGLGHVSEKSKKKDKLPNRLQILEAILDLVTTDDTETTILCNSDMTKKEKRFFNDVISLYNMNRTLNLSNKFENDLCLKIQESMAEVQYQLDLIYHSKRKLTLKKLSSTENKAKKGKKNKPESMMQSVYRPKSPDILELPIDKMEYIILILTKVLKFQKDKSRLVLTVNFDSLLTSKYRAALEKLCSSVNSRTFMTERNVPYRDLANELYEIYDDSFYELTYGLDFKSFTICKVTQVFDTNAYKKKNKAFEVTSEIYSKDTNNGGSKDVELNACTDVVIPKKYQSLILLVQLKTKRCPENIANLITKNINHEIESPPHLKCHGVQEGYIVYSTDTKKSYLWLKNLLINYEVIDYTGMDETYVLQSKMNVCMDYNKVLNLLEKYNPGLHSVEWKLLDVTYFESSIEFIVQLGFNSFDYIRNNNFQLHAGVDEVQFTIKINLNSTHLQVLD